MQKSQALSHHAAAFVGGQICRVGGLELTKRGLKLCAFSPSARLADIGCGQGITVAYLRKAGFNAEGIDIDQEALKLAGPYCRLGDGLALPYPDLSMDGLLYECSLSPISDQAAALEEAKRVLKHDGRLIISDLYTRKSGTFAQSIRSREQWQALVEQAGFTINLFEDRSGDLQRLAAEILWEYGREGLANLYGCNIEPAELKAARVGYFLLLAQKRGAK